MDVRVVLHLEPAGDAGMVWWAESPDVPGFSATDAGLNELVNICEAALADIASDIGALPVVIQWHFASPVSSEGPEISDRDQSRSLGLDLETAGRLVPTA